MERELAEQTLGLCVGSMLHEQWRMGRKTETGEFTPRMKKTNDSKWIAAHGGATECDIANTTFAELPSEYQHENLVAGQIAVRLSLQPGLTIEQMASIVHEEWLKRNGGWASEEQKQPYALLPESEKAKDREQITLALALREKVLRGEISLEEEAIRYGLMTAPALTLKKIEGLTTKAVEQN